MLIYNPSTHMFGLLRFAVVTLMAIGLLGPNGYSLSNQATALFMLLSGYLAAHELHHLTHEPAPRGWLKRYALRTLLPFYALYLPVLALSVTLTLHNSDATYAVQRHYYYVPFSQEGAWLGWLLNFTVLGFTGLAGSLHVPAFVPNMWVMGALFAYWLVLPVLLRKPHFLLVAFCASLYFTAMLYFLRKTNTDYDRWRYVAHFGVFSYLLPFTLGVYLRLKRSERAVRAAPILGMAALLVVVLVQQFNWFNDTYLEGYLLVVALGVVMVYLLSRTDYRAAPYWLASLDRFAYSVAFCLLLVFMPVAGLVTHLCPEMLLDDGSYGYRKPWELFTFSYPLAVVAATALYYAAGKPLAKLAKRF